MGSFFSLGALLEAITTVVTLIIAVTFHEVAHGWVAYKLGDPTAKQAGRLTLNPVKHLDPFGSFILPLMMYLAGGPIFAYAKPVPYNPRNLRNRRIDEVLVALSGPASNIIQVLLAAALMRGLWEIDRSFLLNNAWIIEILTTYGWINTVLCFFNLLPLPPLDGSHVLAFFLRGKALATYERLSRYSMPILIIVLYLLPMLSLNPLGFYFNHTALPFFDTVFFSGIFA